MGKKRTVDQNSLYWVWLACIEDFTGHDKNDLHEYFKARFLGFVSTNIFEEVLTKVISTTSLNTKQFKQYLDKVQIFASAELGVSLPNPEDKYWSEFYNKYKNYL